TGSRASASTPTSSRPASAPRRRGRALPLYRKGRVCRLHTRPSFCRPMRFATALVVLFAHAAPVLAQEGVGCLLDRTDPGYRQAQAFLDVNGVRAGLFNRGQLFFSGGDLYYEVPKGSGIHSLFAAGLWVGGLVNGELRIAAATYAQGGENYE